PEDRKAAAACGHVCRSARDLKPVDAVRAAIVAEQRAKGEVMDRAKLEERLRQADEYVAIAQRHVEGQRRLIARMERSDGDVERRRLGTLEAALRLEIAEINYAPCWRRAAAQIEIRTLPSSVQAPRRSRKPNRPQVNTGGAF